MLHGIFSKSLSQGLFAGELKLRQDLKPIQFVISDLDHLLGPNCSASMSFSLRLAEIEMTLEEVEA